MTNQPTKLSILSPVIIVEIINTVDQLVKTEPRLLR